MKMVMMMNGDDADCGDDGPCNNLFAFEDYQDTSNNSFRLAFLDCEDECTSSVLSKDVFEEYLIHLYDN